MNPVPDGCCWVAKKSAPLISPLASGPVVRSTTVAWTLAPQRTNPAAMARELSKGTFLPFMWVMVFILVFYSPLLSRRDTLLPKVIVELQEQNSARSKTLLHLLRV